jgi:hypothetical protein
MIGHGAFLRQPAGAVNVRLMTPDKSPEAVSGDDVAILQGKSGHWLAQLWSCVRLDGQYQMPSAPYPAASTQTVRCDDWVCGGMPCWYQAHA